MAKAITTNGRRANIGMVIALSLIPQTVAAIANRLETRDSTANPRLVATVPLGRAQSATGIRVGQAAMLHSFRIEAVDANGQPVRDVRFDVTIEAGEGSARRPIARLSDAATEVRLPKPLGYRVNAADSIHVVATAIQGSSAHLRVTIELDAADRGVSRLGVRALAQIRASNGSDSTQRMTRSWSWKAESSGRMLAFAGVALDGVRELVLQDAENGVVIWRKVAGQSTRAERLGVAVEAGRVYTLTAIYGAIESREVSGGSLLALALPSRDAR